MSDSAHNVSTTINMANTQCQLTDNPYIIFILKEEEDIVSFDTSERNEEEKKNRNKNNF